MKDGITQNIKAQVAKVEALKAEAKHSAASQKPWLNNGVKLTVETRFAASCTIRPVQLMMIGEKG